MEQIGKWLVITGVVLTVVGLLAWGRLAPLGRLPGDIVFEGQRTTIYIPIATMLIVSAAVTLLLWFLKSK